MSFLISNITVTQELSLIAVVATAVGCYLMVSLSLSKRRKSSHSVGFTTTGESTQPALQWDDRQSLFWRHSLGPLGQVVDHYFISAFSAELLQKRSAAMQSLNLETKMCVSRSSVDTEKLIHPLIKKIESRLRRAELRPRPRLNINRKLTPFPLYSSTRPDIELSTHVLNFLDACIDLSVSCDTQVNFGFQTDADGISISAEWKKNQLIADATAQIELLDQMRLTMSGEMVRWEYQIFACRAATGEANDPALDIAASA